MIFQAELNYTKKDMLNYIRLHRKTHQKIAYVLRFIANCLIAAFLIFAYTIYFRISGQNRELLLRILLFTVLAVFLQFTDYITAFFMVKNVRSTGVSVCHVDDEQFIIRNDKAKSEYAYSGFSELLYSKKNLTYYCYIGKRVAVVLPERCFTQGDPADFGAFLAEKTGLEVKEMK